MVKVIPRGTILAYFHLRARVLQPLPIEARLSELNGDYVAMSEWCTLFDRGSTPELAIQKFLEWLPDELDWYKRHADQLSPSLIEDWHHLQQYVRLIEDKPEEWEWKRIYHKPHVQAGLRRLEEEAVRQIAAGETEEGGFALDKEEHPLFDVAGMFEIDVPGWADNIDEYIAETYLDRPVEPE